MKTAIMCLLALSLASGEKRGNLIWEDNFDFFNQNVWSHLVTAWRGGNEEFQFYRNNRKNSYVADGLLNIQATPVSDETTDNVIRNGAISLIGCNMEPCISKAENGETVLPTFSARLETRNSIRILYGRIVIRARMPIGDWITPSIYLLPLENKYGEWPASGEITVAEGRGNRNLMDPYQQSFGYDRVVQTLHWGPRVDLSSFERTLYKSYASHGTDFVDDFHEYEVEWTPEYIIFKLDGYLTGGVWPSVGGFWEFGEYSNIPNLYNPWSSGSKMAPFDRPFYIVIELPVGGTFFPEDCTSWGFPIPWNIDNGHPMRDFYENEAFWKSTWTQPLQIDYIRLYQY